MPLIWRYLLRSYFQVFILSLTAFISVLLVTRFQDIAKFATASGNFKSIFMFTLFQIPYILPLAVPVSCLISATILFQKLSHTHELTALRACGMGLRPIAYPMLMVGLLIGFANFTVASEVAPYSRSLSRKLIYDLVASNPLLILQKDAPVKLDGIYSDVRSYRDGQIAKDVILVSKNGSNERLFLMAAKELSLKDEMLFGKDVTLISSFDPQKEGVFDHLLLENQKQMNTKACNLTKHMQTADWVKSSDFLPLKLLIAKQAAEKIGFTSLGKKTKIEIAKRITLGIAPFTFTLIGVAYGLEIGRIKRKKGIILACSLAAFYMVSFIATKSLKSAPSLAIMAYLIPHPIIYMFCIQNMRKVSRGME